MKPLTLLCLVLALLDCPIAGAQDRPPPQDILELSASALSEVPADIAVVTLSVVREGSDVSALTQEADGVLNRALIEGRNVPTVTGSSGGFSTQPRTDRQGNATGWTVHGDLIFRSHDFAALGKLAGKLSGPGFAMQVTSSSFEVSQDLRQSEEGELINRAIAGLQGQGQRRHQGARLCQLDDSRSEAGCARWQRPASDDGARTLGRGRVVAA